MIQEPVTEEDRRLAVAQLKRAAGEYDKANRHGRAERLRSLAMQVDDGRDPLLDQKEFAALAGVGEHTTNQWSVRDKEGAQNPPLPPMDPDSLHQRPAWRFTVLVGYLKDDRQVRWPPGAAGRPGTRGKRHFSQRTGTAAGRV